MDEEPKTKIKEENDYQQEHIGKNLAHALKAFNMYLDFKLKDKGFELSRSPFFLLYTLYKMAPVTQHQLSEHLYVDKAAVNRAAHKLEKQGYIIREASKQDRRKAYFYLTAKAYAWQEEITGLLEEIDGEIKGCFTEEDNEKLLRLLKSIAQVWEEGQSP